MSAALSVALSSAALPAAADFDPLVLAGLPTGIPAGPTTSPVRTHLSGRCDGERTARVTVLVPPADPGAAVPLRLTHRGVAVLTGLLAVLGGALVWSGARSQPPAAAVPQAPPAVTVRSGDTLWSIASRLAPQRDPRAEVAALEAANRLSDARVLPGQVLRVP